MISTSSLLFLFVALLAASQSDALMSTVLSIQGKNLTVTGYANDKLLHHMIKTGDWEPHLYGLAKVRRV